MAEKDRDGPLADGTALAQMERLDGRMREVLAPVVAELQALLDTLAGKALRRLEEKVALATLLQVMLQRLGLRVRCPRCGKPAVLRCRSMAEHSPGAFYFQHQGGGQPKSGHLASPVVPELKLVAAPPDLRRQGRSRRKGQAQ